MKTFEDYLQDVHAKDYSGLDDDMADDFENWLSKLDVQELIDYAEKFAQKRYTAGAKYALESIQSMTVDILSSKPFNS